MFDAVQYNISLFRELITCSYSLYSWTYSADMVCHYTNCPYDESLRDVLCTDIAGALAEYSRKASHLPIMLSDSLNLFWIADSACDSSGNLRDIHVIGPAFIEDIPEKTLAANTAARNLSLPLTRKLLEALKSTPFIPITRLFEYGAMMHYCIWGEKITSAEFHLAAEVSSPAPDIKSDATDNIRTSWKTESALLHLIEEGNPDYKTLHGQLVSQTDLGSFGSGSSLRQLKNTVIIHSSLCARAAIRGGLSPEIAYYLSAQYTNNVEGLSGFEEIYALNEAMMDDFVRRVHQVRVNSGISPQIRKCCDYIQLHLNEKISMTTLAEYTNYSASYLSKKFRDEIGTTVTEYILNLKIERAKELLRSTDMSIREIGESLHFGTPSYFGEQFHRRTGMTASEYRMNIPLI